MPRILYADLARTSGGSLISLYNLVRYIPHPYEAVVVLAEGNPEIEKFSKLGVPVRTVPSLQGAGDRYGGPVDRVRQGWLGAAMRRSALSHLWHGIGFWARMFRRILPQARHFHRMMRDEEIDLVHVNDMVTDSGSFILAAKMAGLPVVWHVRSFNPFHRFDRWLARRVDRMIYISRAIESAAVSQGVPRRIGTVIYNGVKVSEFEGLPSPREAREQLGLPVDGFLVGMIGRLARWKGPHVFLRGLALALQRVPDIRGVIVGAPDKSEEGIWDELQEEVRRLGLEGRVHFAGYQPDVRPWLGAMDMLAHTSLEPEPFGRVIIEGMAAGKPVVATNAGAVPEIVEDGRTGLLVVPGSAEALAEAITGLRRDAALRKRLAEAGRDEVRRRFTASGTTEAVFRVYQEVLRLPAGESRGPAAVGR